MRLAAVAGVVALLAGAAVLAFQPFQSDGPHVRTPLEVAGAFVYHLDRGNMGKACSLIAPKLRGNVEDCSQGLIANEGGMMSFFGIDIFDNARLVPGSQHANPDGSVSFTMRADGFQSVKLTVARQDSGRWRITEID